ncbi:MAG: thioredoxin [Bacteroidales bacterium]|nr:thioredoxin [Bacteroidales bacterium]
MPLVPSNEKIRILDDRNFKHQIKNGKVLVDFWAAWCAPCRAMAPVLNELADELDGTAIIGKLDVDKNREAASAYKIRGIPTMILFKNGKEVERFVGVKSRDFLLKKIREA